MKVLDLSLPSPETNLACDEALLDSCEENSQTEVIRFWESRQVFVVLGYSNKISSEVNRIYCRKHHIPVLRRPSGGGTVLQGPGCLNYALVLDTHKRKNLASITETNRFVMEKNSKALESVLKKPVRVQGHTDLTLGNLKFSGNAQRRKRRFILFHGTFLLDFDLGLIEKALLIPPKQPCYRENRGHSDFVMNLKLSREKIKKALQKEWGAKTHLTAWPKEITRGLIEGQYSRNEWNEKF